MLHHIFLLCPIFYLRILLCSGVIFTPWQSILFLSSLLKRIDRILQFDRCINSFHDEYSGLYQIITIIDFMSLEMACTRLMPSYNGILSVSCIRSLTQIALKLLGFVPLVNNFSPVHCCSNFLYLYVVFGTSCSTWDLLQDRVFELVKPFRDSKAIWQVRVEASRALLDLEFHCKGIDAALELFIKYLDEETSFRGSCQYFQLKNCLSRPFFTLKNIFIPGVCFHHSIIFLDCRAGEIGCACYEIMPD